MKVIKLMTLFVCLSILSFSQTNRDTIYAKPYFKDFDSKLIYEEILKIDSVSASVLINRFENWGGQTFRDFDKVKTSKTDNQITLNYIKDGGSLDFYVILIAEFKDGKVRLGFYDDGNVLKPGYYTGNTYNKGTPSRSFYLEDFFRIHGQGGKDGYIAYKPEPGAFNTKEKAASFLNLYKKDIVTSVKNIEVFLKKETINNPTKSDW